MQQLFKFKKFDSISIVFSFFILFIIILFIYIIQINKHIERYAIYNNTINDLMSINKDFDNLLLQKGNFINYDNINQSIIEFDENIKTLNSNTAHSELSIEYTNLLQEVITHYKVKLDAIEYFKSENS
ncbi:MAG: hypothetical protein KAH72_10495, partial [Flavobacteriaceae bacterium]|nr:hypothetical protein [Flavobacteriaceae bacterium]